MGSSLFGGHDEVLLVAAAEEAPRLSARRRGEGRDPVSSGKVELEAPQGVSSDRRHDTDLGSRVCLPMESLEPRVSEIPISIVVPLITKPSGVVGILRQPEVGATGDDPLGTFEPPRTLNVESPGARVRARVPEREGRQVGGASDAQEAETDQRG